MPRSCELALRTVRNPLASTFRKSLDCFTTTESLDRAGESRRNLDDKVSPGSARTYISRTISAAMACARTVFSGEPSIQSGGGDTPSICFRMLVSVATAPLSSS